MLRGKNRIRLTPKRAPKSKSIIMPRAMTTSPAALALRRKAVSASSSMMAASDSWLIEGRGELMPPPLSAAPSARFRPVSICCGKIHPSANAKSMTPPGVLPTANSVLDKRNCGSISSPPPDHACPSPPKAIVCAGASAANDSNAKASRPYIFLLMLFFPRGRIRAVHRGLVNHKRCPYSSLQAGTSHELYHSHFHLTFLAGISTSY